MNERSCRTQSLKIDDENDSLASYFGTKITRHRAIYPKLLLFLDNLNSIKMQ